MKIKMDSTKELDNEWIQLILEAKSLGIDLSTIRNFLNENEIKKQLIKN